MSPGTSLYWILTSAFLSFNALPHFKINGTPSHLNSRKGWSILFHMDLNTGSQIISDEHIHCIADHFEHQLGLEHWFTDYIWWAYSLHCWSFWAPTYTFEQTKNYFKQTTTLEHQQGWALVQPFVVDPEDCGGKSWAGWALWHCGVLRSGKSDQQMWNLTTNKYFWCCFWFLWVWAPGDIQDVHPHQDG